MHLRVWTFNEPMFLLIVFQTCEGGHLKRLISNLGIIRIIADPHDCTEDGPRLTFLQAVQRMKEKPDPGFPGFWV